MDLKREVCTMGRRSTKKMTSTLKNGALVIGCLVTMVLMVLKYFKVLSYGWEDLMAPALVITLIAYGEYLAIFFIVRAINLAKNVFE